MKPHKIDQALSKLPRHSSPKALDDKIMAYARKQAPKRMSGISTWMRGLALASVAAITVLVVLSQQPTHSPEPIVTAETRLEERKDLSALSKESLAAIQPASPAMEMAPASKASGADNGLKRQALARKQTLDNTDQTQPKRFSSALATRVAIPEKMRANESINMQLEIEKIQALIDQGKDAQAEQAWKALKARCRQCLLPETLPEALKQFSKSE